MKRKCGAVRGTSTTSHLVSLACTHWHENTGTADFKRLIKGVAGYSISHHTYQLLGSFTRARERPESMGSSVC